MFSQSVCLSVMHFFAGSLNKCCESFTRWLLGASEREGASKHDCDVLALPLPVRAKKFK